MQKVFMSCRSNHVAFFVLLLALSWTVSSAQDTSGDASSTNGRAEDALELRGDLPDPHRIDASELHKLPRAEVRTADPHQPGKEIVYAGAPLAEVLKAGGMAPDSGMPKGKTNGSLHSALSPGKFSCILQ
jgi:hypothetical protein